MDWEGDLSLAVSVLGLGENSDQPQYQGFVTHQRNKTWQF